MMLEKESALRSEFNVQMCCVNKSVWLKKTTIIGFFFFFIASMTTW
jgi:hypothetical protein